MSLRFALPFLLVLTASAQAGVLYKCSDDSGRVTYTNAKGGYRNCSVVSRDNTSAPISSSAVAPVKPRAASNPSPADFPRVSNDAQKGRDTDRRRILEQELASEQKNLDDARKSLAEQEAVRAPVDRQQPFRDRVALHSRNLEALQREITKLK